TPAPEGGAAAEAQEPVVQETRPEWLDPRFKTPEDQAKAYKEAEKKMQQEAQTRAELERQNRELLGRMQQPVVPQAPEANYNELFWQNPAEVMDKLLEKRVQAAVQPFIESGYQVQKEAYANDPEFRKYEPIIDQMAASQPGLKSRPGAVKELYRVVRSMDPNYEKSIEERIRQEYQSKTASAVEGAGTPASPKPTSRVELSAEEQAVAMKFYPELSKQEAFKKYHDSKMNMHGGA
ncbi:MAG TPA: hypothetical protein VIY48_21355, partial [Candidatus Paceibacterota bacterium]